ncbi:transmembrane protein 119 [Gastrophryne carolinensis]
MGHLLALCMFLFVMYPISLARYTTDPESGSGEGDGTAINAATQSYGFTTENTVKNVNGTTNSSNILETIKQFLNEYMLLVIVVGSLVILLIVTMCAAVIMSHKRKASAYYPSSFAPKEYVNHDDRNGGARSFNEIPEKPHDAKDEEVVTSNNQLQNDILNAAQNLKSPTKGGGIKGQNTQGPLKKEHTEEVPADKSPESSQTLEETTDDKVIEAPIEKAEETKPTCNCTGPPAKPLEEVKPTGNSQEGPAGAPEESIPTADSQEAPAKPVEESTPPDNSQETQAEIPEETKPTDASLEVPAEPIIDAPNAPEQLQGKEEGNPTPTECGSAKYNSCNNQETQQTTEPCGV